MAFDVIRTIRLNDRSIVSLARGLCELLPEASGTIRAIGNSDFFVSSDERIDLRQFDRDGHSIRSFELKSPIINTVVKFERGIVNPQDWSGVNYQQSTSVFSAKRIPSALYDEIGFFRLEYNQRRGSIDFEKAKKVDQLISEYLVPLDAGDDNSLMYANSLAAKQIDDLRAINIEVTESLNRSRESLENEYRALGKTLEEEHERRAQALQNEREKLEKWREEINDREPQHERRRLREVLTERLQNTLTSAPQKSRRSEFNTYYLYLAIGLIFVTVSVILTLTSDYGVDIASPKFWAESIKSFASGIAGAAFAWAGLAGLKASAIADRNFERGVQRYAFDMDRASWVVETILQMSSVEKNEIPTQWLESVCHDLFSASDTHHEQSNSLDALAALLDATARAKVGTGGFEFEIDKRGVRRLTKDAEGSS